MKAVVETVRSNERRLWFCELNEDGEHVGLKATDCLPFLHAWMVSFIRLTGNSVEIRGIHRRIVRLGRCEGEEGLACLGSVVQGHYQIWVKTLWRF